MASIIEMENNREDDDDGNNNDTNGEDGAVDNMDTDNTAANADNAAGHADTTAGNYMIQPLPLLSLTHSPIR